MRQRFRFALVTVVAFTGSLTAVAAPGVEELVKAYAEHQDRILHFTDKFQFEENVDARYTLPRLQRDKETTWGIDGEFSYDGERFLLWNRDWYETPHADGYGSKQNPGVHMYLWDGLMQWQYDARTVPLPGLPPGHAQVTRNLSACSKLHDFWFENPRYRFSIHNYLGYPALGFILGGALKDFRRLDEIIANARSVSLRPTAEEASEIPCYVVDAELPEGVLSVWFDPERQYNILQAAFQYRQGHVNPQWPELQMAQGYMRYRAVDIVQVDGLWVPKEVAWEIKLEYTRGDYLDSRCRFRRLSYELNPDFDSRRTFEASGLANGAEVREWDCNKNPGPVYGIEYPGEVYVWHDGRLVPKAER